MYDYLLKPGDLPTTPVFTTAEAKLHLRIDASNAAEDTYIDGLVASATQRCEKWMDRQIYLREYTLYLNEFPSGRDPIYFPLGQFFDVPSSIIYYNTAGTATPLLVASLIQVGSSTDSGCIVPLVGAVWPVSIDESVIPYAVNVPFRSGWQAVEDIPQPIKQAILLDVGSMYEHRESQVVGTIASELPIGIKDMLMPFKLGDEFARYGGSCVAES